MQPPFPSLPGQAAAFVLVALMLIVVLRWRIAMPISESKEPAAWPGARKDQPQPEAERAPRRLWPLGLSAAVAVTAAVRVALLVTLHA
jgi:hypothetical protein